MDNELLKTRYYLEHRLFPKWLFENKGKFIETLTKGREDFVFKVLQDMCIEDFISCAYKKEDFKVNTVKLEDDVYLIDIKMPEPEKSPLCYSIYMIFNKEEDNFGYFTLEKRIDAEKGKEALLCGWDKYEHHYNYGAVTLEDALVKAVHVFILSCEEKNKK